MKIESEKVQLILNQIMEVVHKHEVYVGELAYISTHLMAHAIQNSELSPPEQLDMVNEAAIQLLELICVTDVNFYEFINKKRKSEKNKEDQ